MATLELRSVHTSYTKKDLCKIIDKYKLDININQNRNNFLKSIDGFGSKRVFGVYVGINQNLSRIYKKLVETIKNDLTNYRQYLTS